MMSQRRARRFARRQKSETVRRWYFWRLYLDEYEVRQVTRSSSDLDAATDRADG